MQINRLFGVTGAVQGWGLWGLWHAMEHHSWPATEPLLLYGLWWLLVSVPLAIYWTEDMPTLSRRARTTWVAALGVFFALLGTSVAWSVGLDMEASVDHGEMFASTCAGLVLGFAVLHLLTLFRGSREGWRYQELFEYSWRNGILAAMAACLAGAFWMVLFAGAALLNLVGIDWVKEMIHKSVFAIPVTALVVSGAMGLGIRRAGMTETIRRFVLSIMSWLLPLVLLFGVAWVAVLPFTGVELLFKTKSAAWMMLWFSALSILFANCAYQDGADPKPYPGWLNRVTQGAWLSLLPVMLIAIWALGQRVRQYGWSEDRIWGALACAVTLVHATGYSLSWLNRSRWMSAMGRTNVVAAILMCVGMALLLSPLADARRIGVASQVNRYMPSGQPGTVEPDWYYLRRDGGRFGRLQLKAWADGQGLPAGHAWIEQSKHELTRLAKDKQLDLPTTPENIRKQLATHPAGKSLPESFVKEMSKDRADWRMRACLKSGTLCQVWMGDLNGDGQDEVVMFSPENGYRTPTVFYWNDKGWVSVYGYGTRQGEAAQKPIRPEDLEQLTTEPSRWRDIVVGGMRFGFKP